MVTDGGIAGWPYVQALLSTDKPNLGQKGAEMPGPPATLDEMSPSATGSPTG